MKKKKQRDFEVVCILWLQRDTKPELVWNSFSKRREPNQSPDCVSADEKINGFNINMVSLLLY